MYKRILTAQQMRVLLKANWGKEPPLPLSSVRTLSMKAWGRTHSGIPGGKWVDEKMIRFVYPKTHTGVLGLNLGPCTAICLENALLSAVYSKVTTKIKATKA